MFQELYLSSRLDPNPSSEQGGGCLKCRMYAHPRFNDSAWFPPHPHDSAGLHLVIYNLNSFFFSFFSRLSFLSSNFFFFFSCFLTFRIESIFISVKILFFNMRLSAYFYICITQWKKQQMNKFIFVELSLDYMIALQVEGGNLVNSLLDTPATLLPDNQTDNRNPIQYHKSVNSGLRIRYPE